MNFVKNTPAYCIYIYIVLHTVYLHNNVMFQLICNVFTLSCFYFRIHIVIAVHCSYMDGVRFASIWFIDALLNHYLLHGGIQIYDFNAQFNFLDWINVKLYNVVAPHNSSFVSAIFMSKPYTHTHTSSIRLYILSSLYNMQKMIEKSNRAQTT